VQTTTNDSIAVVASTVKVRFSPSRDECTLLPADHELFPTAFKKKQLNWKIYKWLTIKAETLWIKMIVCGQKFPFRKSGA